MINLLIVSRGDHVSKVRDARGKGLVRLRLNYPPYFLHVAFDVWWLGVVEGGKTMGAYSVLS